VKLFSFYIDRVPFFAIYPRIRLTESCIELIWLGFNIARFRTNERPVRLLLAGKKIFNQHPDGYKPEGFPGGTCADFVPNGDYCYEYREWKPLVLPDGHEVVEPVRDSYYRCPSGTSTLVVPSKTMDTVIS
jgi:hypothetical protein